MNQITVAGHLGADPEVRFTSSGQKVTTVRVAARARKGTIWWRVTIWGEQFDKMMPYFKKGSPIIVFGELDMPEIFTDRDGRPQPSMNITAKDISFSPFGRPDGQGADQHPQSSHASHDQQDRPKKTFDEGQQQAQPAAALADDEIPF